MANWPYLGKGIECLQQIKEDEHGKRHGFGVVDAAAEERKLLAQSISDKFLETYCRIYYGRCSFALTTGADRESGVRHFVHYSDAPSIREIVDMTRGRYGVIKRNEPNIGTRVPNPHPPPPTMRALYILLTLRYSLLLAGG